MMSRRIASLLIIGVVFGVGTPRASAQKIYWTEGSPDAKIRRVNIDGSGAADVIAGGLTDVIGIAIDPEGGKMYWVDNGAAKIQRANLDGSKIEDLVTGGLVDARAIALDVINRKMYWTDSDRISRANLDGTEVEMFLMLEQPSQTPRGLAIDVAAGTLYWFGRAAVGGTGIIHRVSVDGGEVVDLVQGNVNATGGFALVVAPTLGKLYWTSFGLLGVSGVRRSNLDGSGEEELVAGGSPRALTVDAARGKMYWTRAEAPIEIRRANLDGSSAASFLSNVPARAMALDVPAVPISGEIPAMSAGGVILMALLLCVAALVVIRNRRSTNGTAVAGNSQ